MVWIVICKQVLNVEMREKLVWNVIWSNLRLCSFDIKWSCVCELRKSTAQFVGISVLLFYSQTQTILQQIWLWYNNYIFKTLCVQIYSAVGKNSINWENERNTLQNICECEKAIFECDLPIFCSVISTPKKSSH